MQSKRKKCLTIKNWFDNHIHIDRNKVLQGSFKFNIFLLSYYKFYSYLISESDLHGLLKIRLKLAKYSEGFILKYSVVARAENRERIAKR